LRLNAKLQQVADQFVVDILSISTHWIYIFVLHKWLEGGARPIPFSIPCVSDSGTSVYVIDIARIRLWLIYRFRYFIPVEILFTYGCYYTACAADPGIITKENLQKYMDLYPYDGLIFEPRDCSTCKMPKYVNCFLNLSEWIC
jgi:hypothetical protein